MADCETIHIVVGDKTYNIKAPQAEAQRIKEDPTYAAKVVQAFVLATKLSTNGQEVRTNEVECPENRPTNFVASKTRVCIKVPQAEAQRIKQDNVYAAKVVQALVFSGKLPMACNAAILSNSVDRDCEETVEYEDDYVEECIEDAPDENLAAVEDTEEESPSLNIGKTISPQDELPVVVPSTVGSSSQNDKPGEKCNVKKRRVDADISIDIPPPDIVKCKKTSKVIVRNLEEIAKLEKDLETRKTLRMQRRQIARLKKKLAALKPMCKKKSSKDEIQYLIDLSSKYLPEKCHALFAAQLKHTLNLPQGVRWEQVEKDLAMSLLSISRKAYNACATYLVLPMPVTVKRWAADRAVTDEHMNSIERAIHNTDDDSSLGSTSGQVHEVCVTTLEEAIVSSTIIELAVSSDVGNGTVGAQAYCF